MMRVGPPPDHPAFDTRPPDPLDAATRSGRESEAMDQAPSKDAVAATALDPRQLSKLESAINKAELGWFLCFVGEDQREKLADLTNDLKAPPSETGDGKQFASGFAYWGIGPTDAWKKACDDPNYRVMSQSDRYFSKSLEQIDHRLEGGSYRCYVSLGVGTGSKDYNILNSKLIDKKGYYFPVDMSPEMLRVGIQAATKGSRPDRHQVLPVQIDFSRDENVSALQKLFEHFSEDGPILFSLLGNTLANFDPDTALLKTLSTLIRPQDKILVEVATTGSLADRAAAEAAEEYRSSKQFKQFACSALLQNTDLRLGLKNLEFQPAVEGDRALRIKVIYRNPDEATFTLPNYEMVDFPEKDTIRLYLTRKYVAEKLGDLAGECGLAILDQKNKVFTNNRHQFKFGTSLLLLGLGPRRPEKAYDIFLAHRSTGSDLAGKLYAFLEMKCKVFLDDRSMEPFEHWFKTLDEAQQNSLMTAVLLPDAEKGANYVDEEIARGLQLERMGSHRLVIIHKKRPDPRKLLPYGLQSKRSIIFPEGLDVEGGVESVGRDLLAALDACRKIIERNNNI
jgi:L-histidine Nalpha-methyltransferase